MDVYRTGYAPAPVPAPGSGEFAPAAAQAPAPQVSEARPAETRSEGDSLRRAVDGINSSLATHGRHLSIRHHEPTNRRIVTVYDSNTNEIVREIPPERVLAAHANMLEMAGLLMDTRG
ncbi:MAG: flagellar protein FlaG [Defluviitaleaceae bacterium]|nr:flagellar protein FlaG [Defluviitaleaceae bacterium]